MRLNKARKGKYMFRNVMWVVRYIQVVIWAFSTILVVHGQAIPPINDGPYVFYKGDSIEVNRIAAGQLIRNTYHKDDLDSVDVQILPSVYVLLSSLRPEDVKTKSGNHISGVKKWVALSDIHGQYQLMMDLFIANKVVDQEGNWSFGNGHLIVTGDILDRGDKCTEILWKLVHLERQAREHGGAVHVTMGNHEMMVLKSDLRYINKKYTYSSVILKRIYSSFFKNDSFLGQWVRSKPVYLTIDDVGFVHAGVHPDYFQWGIDIEELNSFFKQNIVENNLGEINRDTLLTWMYYENGPLWFRGLADLEAFTKKDAKKLLKKLDLEHLVVGHTSMPEIRSIYDNKVIFIDSSIKLGLNGELLFWEGGRFYRAGLAGKRIPLKPVY